MAPRQLTVQLTFDGPFNIGSGAMGGSPADKPLLRDDRGLPIVPGSSFKGRLRHEAERLCPVLFPDERPPCQAPVAESMCQGDEPPCLVCRIFGSPWTPGKLQVGDLILSQPEFLTRERSRVAGSLRYGVGISRHRRVAEDNLLFTTEVFLPGTPITFSGTLRGDLDETETALLEAALQSLYAIGGGKTRGLGWFVASYQAVDVPAPAPSQVASAAGWLDVVVQLESSLLLGSETSEAYYNTTRTYIPGSVLRGSLARHLMAQCHHNAHAPDEACTFAQIFQDGALPLFDHLLPTTPGGREFAFPAPLTARSCKYHPGFKNTKRAANQGHGVGDVLIPQFVYERVLDRGIALPVLYRPRCPTCAYPGETDTFDEWMVIAGPTAFDQVEVPVRRTSRTAIDRRRAVAADGQLYTLEIIEPTDGHEQRTTFAGRVFAHTADQAAHLQAALGQLQALGRKQTSGLGHVRVSVRPANQAALPDVAARLRDFNQALRAEWDFYVRTVGVEPLPDDVQFFCLDLLAPAVLTWRGLPVTAPPPAMLGLAADVTLVRAFAQFHTLGGWHLGARLPRRTQFVAAMGSVFLYQCRGLTTDELDRQLTLIEANGIGDDRARGLGRVVVCLPFHYQAEVNL